MTHFFLLRALERREEKATKELAQLAKQNNIPIVAVAAIPNLPGHIVVECEMKHQILQLLPRLKNVRGLVRGKVDLDDIMRLISKPIDLFKPGEEIEITGGPFKGNRAKILTDDGKTVTIEVLEWERSMRITISRDYVRRRR